MRDDREVERALKMILITLSQAYLDKKRLTQDDLMALMTWAESGLENLGAPADRHMKNWPERG